MSESRIRDLLKLDYVPRWPGIPMGRDQSVAAHSFNVAVICMEMLRMLSATDDARTPFVDWTGTLMMALEHDGPESESGDINSMFKKNILSPNGAAAWEAAEERACPWVTPRYRRNPYGAAIVDIADKMEATLWAARWAPAPVSVQCNMAAQACVKKYSESLKWPGLQSVASQLMAFLLKTQLAELQYEPSQPQSAQ